MLAKAEAKAQVPLADRKGKPDKSNCSDAQVAKIKKELAFARKRNCQAQEPTASI